MTEPDDTVFPIDQKDTPMAIIQGEPGLTKREYFSALAMQGTFASMASREMLEMLSAAGKSDGKSCTELVAWQSVLAADSLIKALNEKSK